MRSRVVFITMVLGLLLSGFSVFAQEVAARLEADTNRIRIGEPLTLRLQLSQPKGLDISWPSWLDSLSGVEVLRIADVDTPETNDNGVFLRSQTVVVTSFDSGGLQLPAVQFSYLLKDGKKILFETDPIAVQVFTVEVDTTQAFRDIKGNVTVPWDYRLIAMWIAGILLLAGLLFWLYRRFGKKKTVKVPMETTMAIAPDIRALEELRLLDESRVWQSGDQKAYHTRLTDILRTYIFERYQVNAPELTTDDLIGHSLVRTLPALERENLERILRLADLVKFAKYTSLPDECQWTMIAATSFVSATGNRKEIPNTETQEVANGTLD
ncbi:MAG: hypothetical protein RLZZ630_1784 [Bacteroidota bacterium]